jgi:hypothetical protein
LKAGPNWKAHDLVFCNSTGEPYSVGYLEKQWKKTLIGETAGDVPQLRHQAYRGDAFTSGQTFAQGRLRTARECQREHHA